MQTVNFGLSLIGKADLLEKTKTLLITANNLIRVLPIYKRVSVCPINLGQ